MNSNDSVQTFFIIPLSEKVNLGTDEPFLILLFVLSMNLCDKVF